MCGIIGVISRPPTRVVPSGENLIGGLDAALDARPDLVMMTDAVAEVDRALRGVPGALALTGVPDLVASLTSRLDRLDGFAAMREVELDGDAVALSADELEVENARLVAFKDVLWAIRNDRFRIAHEVEQLAGRDAPPSAIAAYLVALQAFSSLDRLEVRGRDSAGIHLYVWNHDIESEALDELLTHRSSPLFESGSVVMTRKAEVSDGRVLSFVYKRAAEIGELGENTAALRAALASDRLFRRAVSAPRARVALLGHTRWASVGVISESNAHPVNSYEAEQSGGTEHPYVVAALNGDVDNHGDLRIEHGLHVPSAITTDAKVIPTIVSRQLADGLNPIEAFRRTVSTFEGSVAIGAMSSDHPDTLMIALRGSGQGLYVGLADDCYIVASEPYGVVEETNSYVRMNGEQGGEIIALAAADAGDLSGVRRWSYDGAERPITDDDVTIAEVTTRDIDRGDSPHFLLKEIAESPSSFAKTLRGKITAAPDATLRAHLGERALPAGVVGLLANGAIRRIRLIGQGTAAVAGQSAAAILDELSNSELDVDAITATELSGFHLRLDMSDTLAIAVSQSGTTTDTNRTVDLIRARGGKVLAIVNRRASDLVDKADGVLYTSDGRDVEMSVASTKAFYAQVAAGALYACAIAEAAGVGDVSGRSALLSSLRAMPDAMRAALELRPTIAAAAQRVAPSKRYWAVVGNGPNKVAAEEVRIKLSELCYKSMACDSTEDKKHIDLSSEPLILVCAAGLEGSIADDVAKEVAIFKAHKATPIVFASAGETRFQAEAVIEVPRVHPTLGFVLSAMVGHLFGYEAALAIDALANPLRKTRELIDELASGKAVDLELLNRLKSEVRPVIGSFHDGLRAGRYDGHLEASTAVRAISLLGSLASDRPVESYQFATGKVATPASLIDDLVGALSHAIDELTRPVDTIKHQAKTVTVGISRSDEGIINRPLVQAALNAGAGRDVLSYRVLKVLADLDPAVAEVRGFTRYEIEGQQIAIIDRGGISRNLTSRVDGIAELRGTKHRVVAEREVLVARGRSDGRTVILTPEVKSGEVTGITLLHVAFHEYCEPSVLRSVLQGYDRRYDRLVDWVSETEGTFDESVLGTVPVADLLVGPISQTADYWRTNGS